jgi:hypothetical protein
VAVPAPAAPAVEVPGLAAAAATVPAVAPPAPPAVAATAPTVPDFTAFPSPAVAATAPTVADFTAFPPPAVAATAPTVADFTAFPPPAVAATPSTAGASTFGGPFGLLLAQQTASVRRAFCPARAAPPAFVPQFVSSPAPPVAPVFRATRVPPLAPAPVPSVVPFPPVLPVPHPLPTLRGPVSPSLSDEPEVQTLLQQLCAPLHEARAALLRATLADTPRHVALLESASARGASGWLRALPQGGDGTFHPAPFRARLCYQLLVPLFPERPRCPIGRCGVVLDVWGDHAVHCKHGAAVAITARHQSLVRTLVSLARVGGFPVGTEWSLPGQPGAERPGDLVILQWQDQVHFWFDVAVVSPLTQPVTAAWRRGDAVRQCALDKRLRYAEAFRQARGYPCTFVPLVFDTLGGCHEELVTPVLDRLEEAVSSVVLVSDDRHYRSVRMQISSQIAASVGLQLSARLTRLVG